MKKLLLALLALTPLLGCGGRAGMLVRSLFDPLPAQKLSLPDGGNTLSYAMKLGDGEPETALVFISGSGHASLQYYLRDYFEGLPGNVLVFALQKRGVSDREMGMGAPSEEFLERDRFDQWLADQAHFLEEVQRRLPGSVRRVVLMGVSEGATTAACLAARQAGVTHLVVLGSGGTPKAQELPLLFPGADFAPAYAAIRAAPERTDRFFLGRSFRYWSSVLWVDPMECYERLEIPILLAMGERDRSAPLASAELLAARFEQRGGTQLRFLRFPDCGHTLVDSAGRNHRGAFLAEMASWWSLP